MSLLNNLFDPFNDSSSGEDEDKISSRSAVKSQELKKRLHSHDESSTDQPKPKIRAVHQATDISDTNDNLVSNLGVEIKMYTVETLDKCLHEVAMPSNMVYTPLKKPKKLLKDYKFTLDPFQKEAITCIENNESVLVSAHTSSGKTVVGEYSILKSLHLKQRVVYTTPIKALSNQKYREFQEQFDDVGLITGDVTINPNASCLIMTTEILRNMLYRGSEIMREVAWVVFDEIHYMRDADRGVVWEEALILLPDNVRYVFLSATIPNARQFAQWIVHIHKQACHVVYTDFRPTPLQHFIFPVGGDNIYTIVDEQGKFNENKFEVACNVASERSNKGRNKEQTKGNNDKETSCMRLLEQIMIDGHCPALIFSFSKKDCEKFAMEMIKMNLDLITARQKILVDEVFQNAIAVLSEEDRRLPQVVNFLPLLRKGVGVHHGGLLPILKETVEILFSEGLIKALFATETFAMGLNMPAKCVVFTSLKKFDGKDVRRITSGEYIQMSGRAGRRGLDKTGTVIILLDEPLSIDEAKDLMHGKADPLKSAFRLTYNMILNLIRIEHINPEYLIERSFLQFQHRYNISNLQKESVELEEKISKIIIDQEPMIRSYLRLKKKYSELNKEFQSFITNPKYLEPFLIPGRMALVKFNGEDIEWGMVRSYRIASKNEKDQLGAADSDVKLLITFVLRIDVNSNEDCPKPCLFSMVPGKNIFITLPNDEVQSVSSVVLSVHKDAGELDAKACYANAVKECYNRFPVLDPVKDMNISDKHFQQIVRDMAKIDRKLKKHPANQFKSLEEILCAFREKAKLKRSLENVKNDMNSWMSLLQMEELKCRKRVLRKLKFCTETDVIELKGRIGCGISCADELLLTEMIFSGLFKELSPQQSAALLSCFVCEGKSEANVKLSEELAIPLREAKDIARNIVKVSKQAQINISEDMYVDQMKPYLMDVVFLWCNGSSFQEICKKTDVFEGSIIRCIRGLEELLRELKQSAATMGNEDLENKFGTAINMIKRDIVFAASLYI